MSDAPAPVGPPRAALSNLVAWVVVVLAVSTAVEHLVQFQVTWELWGARKAGFADPYSEWTVVRLTQAGRLLTLVTPIAWLTWLAGAVRELRARGAQLREPAAFVGDYFIPVANLWRPVPALGGLLRLAKGRSMDTGTAASDTALALGWWGGTLAALTLELRGLWRALERPPVYGPALLIQVQLIAIVAAASAAALLVSRLQQRLAGR